MKSNWLNMVEFLYMSHVLFLKKNTYCFYFQNIIIRHIEIMILFQLLAMRISIQLYASSASENL